MLDLFFRSWCGAMTLVRVLSLWVLSLLRYLSSLAAGCPLAPQRSGTPDVGTLLELLDLQSCCSMPFCLVLLF